MTGETVQSCQPVDDIIRLGRLLEQFVEMLPCCDVVTHIHQRDSIVEMLFSTLELVCRRTLNMLVAGIEVKGGPVGEFLDGAADDLLKMRLRLIEFMFLHGAQTGFVTL